MKPNKYTDNQRVADEVNQTLQSLEGMERATPNPFFLTRVQARLSHRPAPNPLTAWVFRPAWVVASLGLILLLNVSGVVYIQERLSQHEQEQETVGIAAEWESELGLFNW